MSNYMDLSKLILTSHPHQIMVAITIITIFSFATYL